MFPPVVFTNIKIFIVNSPFLRKVKGMADVFAHCGHTMKNFQNIILC